MIAWIIGSYLGTFSPDVDSRKPVSVEKAKTQSGVPDAWSAIVASRTGISLSTRAIPSQIEVLSGPFGANVDELKRRAETGDAEAAKALADGYRRCEFFTPPTDRSALEKRAEDNTVFQLGLVDQIIDQVKQQATEKGIDIGKIPEIEAMPAYKAQLVAESTLTEACRNVSVADARKWLDWYARAAGLGDADAGLATGKRRSLGRIARRLVSSSNRKTLPPRTFNKALRGETGARWLQSVPFWRWAIFPIRICFQRTLISSPLSQGPHSDIGALPRIGNGLERLFTGNDTHTYFRRELQRTAATLDQR